MRVRIRLSRVDIKSNIIFGCLLTLEADDVKSDRISKKLLDAYLAGNSVDWDGFSDGVTNFEDSIDA